MVVGVCEVFEECVGYVRVCTFGPLPYCNEIPDWESLHYCHTSKWILSYIDTNVRIDYVGTSSHLKHRYTSFFKGFKRKRLDQLYFMRTATISNCYHNFETNFPTDLYSLPFRVINCFHASYVIILAE